MFQTESVIFLQSFATDFLTLFFTFFTEVGRSVYGIILLTVILFGVSFRTGFIICHAVAWNGLITMNLKEYFSLPRPFHVDSNVKLLGQGIPNPTQFVSMGAKYFFGCLPSQVVAYFRALPLESWGFPSGHASHAMTLWGSCFMVSKRFWIRSIAVTMVVFISLSRMYLGRHFLADILAGLMLGLVMIVVFCNFIYRNEKVKSVVFKRIGKVRLDLKSALLGAYLLITPLLALFLMKVEAKYVAAFLGLNIGFLVVRVRGIPQDSGTIYQRMARILIAGVLFLVIHNVLEKGSGLFFSNKPLSVEFIQQALSFMLFFWGTTEVNVKLGLYKR